MLTRPKKSTGSFLTTRLFIIGLLFSVVSVHGQYNYVSNPSLEDTIICPLGGGELTDTATVNWKSASLASPDGLYICNGFVPELPWWYGPWHNEYPKHGSGYGGVYTVYYYDPSADSSYREYMHGELTEPLIAGVEYCVSFWVSLADSLTYAVDGFGAYFSDTEIFYNGSGNLPFTPQVSNPAGNVLTEINGWTEISGSFIASGGEEFIVLGNFKADFNTTVQYVGSGSLEDHSYYLVDAISVTEAGDMASAGNDVTIFAGDSVFIGEPGISAERSWYQEGTLIATNHSGIYVQPLNSTWYVLQQELCGIVYSDTVYVDVKDHSVIQTNDVENIAVYPNPTGDVLYISYDDNSKTEKGGFNMYDMTGQLVFYKELYGITGPVILDISGLQQGTYYYSVFSDITLSPISGLMIVQR